MAYKKSHNDVDITREDLKQIKEAFKNEEFRNLLNNYFEEVNDPKNKAIYQSELTEFERNRGVDVTFINPDEGYVIKSSSDGNRKAFINICSNENVGKPSSNAVVENGSRGLNWSIPFLQGPPRDDLDNKNELCLVFDVVFHPDTLYLAKKDDRIKKLVDDTALSAVEDSFQVKLDRKNLVFPRIKYKGPKVSTVIRRRRSDYVDSTEQEDDILSGCPYPYNPPLKENIPTTHVPRGNFDDNSSLYTTPRYIVKHRRDFDMQEFRNSQDSKFHSAIPSELVVEIDLPLVRSAADVNLDVVDKSLSLISENPAKYKLDVNLPYSVDDESGNAKFDKKKKKLIVTLPVIRSKVPKDFIREDSGIESDVNHNNCSSSEEDIRKGIEVLQTSDSNEVSEERIDSDKLMRTSEEIKSQFLRDDIHYSFPNNAVSIKENILSFKLMVRNIDPHSITHQFMEASEGVHVKFCTLGAGFFPVHYAFCLSIPGTIMDTTSMKVDVWDDYLVSTLTVSIYKDKINSYFVGISPNELEEKELIPLDKISKEVLNLQFDVKNLIQNVCPDDENSNKTSQISSKETLNTCAKSTDPN